MIFFSSHLLMYCNVSVLQGCKIVVDETRDGDSQRGGENQCSSIIATIKTVCKLSQRNTFPHACVLEQEIVVLEEYPLREAFI